MHVETINLGFGSLVYKRAHFISATYSLVYHCYLMTATHNADLSFYRKGFFVIIGCFFCFFNSINEWVGIIAIEAPYVWFCSPLKTNTLINENRRNWEMRAKRIRISHIGVNDLWTCTYIVWYWLNLIFCMDIQMQYHYL